MTKRSLRIAICAGVAPTKLGSLEDTLIAIVERARQRGHECTVISYGPLHERFAEKLRARETRWLSLSDFERSFLAGVRRFRAEFDVVFATLVPFRAPLLRQAWCAWPVRVVLQDGNSPEAASGRRHPLSVALDPLVFGRAAKVVAVSDFIRDRLTTVFRLDPSRTCTIYNGVDLSRFGGEARASSASHDTSPLILGVANLVPQKGVDILIDALSRLERTDARLTIVGDGPARPALVAQASALGLTDRVEFLGVRDDVEEHLARCTVFVHPARWQEAFGYTVAEAMAAGRPVVASRIGALPELVAHGESGLLVDPDHPAELADALNQLLRDPAVAQRMGMEGRSRAERLFSLTYSAEALVSTFEEVVE